MHGGRGAGMDHAAHDIAVALLGRKIDRGRSALLAAADVAQVNGLPEPAVDGFGKGLMRTEIDRAVSSWREENGDTTSLYGGAKLLAKEVTSLAFQYWDGAEWTTDWDSDELGGLPLAVEIVLTIQPTHAMSEEEITNLALSSTATLPAERRAA